MCKFKDTNLGIKKLDFNVKRGAMAAYQAPDKEAARGMDDYGRPVLFLRGTEPHLFRQRLAQTLNRRNQ